MGHWLLNPVGSPAVGSPTKIPANAFFSPSVAQPSTYMVLNVVGLDRSVCRYRSTDQCWCRYIVTHENHSNHEDLANLRRSTKWAQDAEWRKMDASARKPGMDAI